MTWLLVTGAATIGLGWLLAYRQGNSAPVPMGPPGWYRDPSGSGRRRFFDGRTWTDRFLTPDGSEDATEIA